MGIKFGLNCGLAAWLLGRLAGWPAASLAPWLGRWLASLAPSGWPGPALDAARRHAADGTSRRKQRSGSGPVDPGVGAREAMESSNERARQRKEGQRLDVEVVLAAIMVAVADAHVASVLSASQLATGAGAVLIFWGGRRRPVR